MRGTSRGRAVARAPMFATLLLSLSCMTPQQPLPATKNPPELGAVAWRRDLDAVLQQRPQRPVFLLFQEIPGCDTCTGFGKHVLSNALLAEAIEQCFVPVVVRNNVDGQEGAWRERYQEPSWNNPVVRLLDVDGKDLLPRADGLWTRHAISARMIEALEKAKQPVPEFLRVAHAESDPAVTTVVFEMHCFWEGEALLGGLDGVVRTTSAFRGGAEVVEVTFRPAVIPRAKLTAHAQQHSCRPVAGDGVQAAPAKDQQHALGGTPFAKVELTPMQRTKVHADLTEGRDGLRWLSPKQRAAYAAVQTKANRTPGK